MSIIGLDPSNVRLPGQPREFKLGTIAESVDRDGFARIYQYCTVSTGTVALGSVCLLSSGGSARALNTSRAASGSGDASRIGVAVSTISAGGSGWFQIYGTCRISVDGPTPVATRLYSTDTDGAVANEVSASFISGLATTSPTGGAGTPLGFINWATTVSSTGDGTQGPPGPQGPQGPAGADGTDGVDGASAYDIAVADGFEGTEAEWLDSLVGPQGPAGPGGGDSAYDIAVANGFVGTQEEWLESLEGAPGPQGPAGPAGGGDVSGDRWLDDFGTVGDGGNHPLSETYETLEDAQVDYPYATALTQQKDYCALLTALYDAPGTDDHIVTIRMRAQHWYYWGQDSFQPTRRVKLVGCGASANNIVVDQFGPGNIGVPGIRVFDADAGESIFEDFALKTTATGRRFRGGTIYEYNAADGLLGMNDGVNSIQNKWFELRNAASPGYTSEGRFQTGTGAPFGTTTRCVLINGNPSSFTPGEQLTVIRGGVPVAVATITFCSTKMVALMTTTPSQSFVFNETITGSVSGATAAFLQIHSIAGFHTVQVLAAEGIFDSGSYLTDPTLRQIYTEEGTFAHGIEFNQVCYATRVEVSGFGGDGFKVVSGADGRSGNSNRSWLNRCTANSNGGNGYTLAGSDGNVCTVVECNAVNNGGWGFNDRAFLGSTFIACHAALNLTGGYKSDRNTTIIGIYVEGANSTYPHLYPENRVGGDTVSFNGQSGVPTTTAVGSGARMTGKLIKHAHFNGEIDGTLTLGYNGAGSVGGRPSLVVQDGPIEFGGASISASDAGGVFRTVYRPYFRFHNEDGTWFRNGSTFLLSATGGNGKFWATYTVNETTGAIDSVNILSQGSSYDPLTSAITISGSETGSGAVLKPIVGPKKGIQDVIIINGGSGYTGSRDWRECLGFTGNGIAVGAQWSGDEAIISTTGPDTDHNLVLSPKGANGTVRVPHLKINNGPVLRSGSGSPEGVLAAPVGSIYVRTNGGAGTTLYIKESGTDSTGWVAK